MQVWVATTNLGTVETTSGEPTRKDAEMQTQCDLGDALLNESRRDVDTVHAIDNFCVHFLDGRVQIHHVQNLCRNCV